MANFAAVAFLDPFELAASLRTRWGRFHGDPGGLRTMSIRGAPAGAADPDDDATFGFYRQAGVRSGKWPEMAALLDRLERLGGQDYGRIWLEMYPPGYRGWRDPEPPAYAERFSRAVMALRWNPEAALFSGRESQVLVPGFLTLVNHRTICGAMNLGEWETVALVIDGRKGEDDG